MAGDGAASPLDGQAQRRPTDGTTAIATAAHVLYAGDLVGKPPILRLTAGNVAGQGAEQQIAQYPPQNQGKHPTPNRKAEEKRNHPNRKIGPEQRPIEGVGAVTPVHKLRHRIAKTLKHRGAPFLFLSIGGFCNGYVMNV